MKKFFIAILFLFVTVTQAQWLSNASVQSDRNGAIITFSGTLDTLGGTYESLTSNPFSLADFDGVTDIDYTHYVTSTAGTPKVKVTLLKSNRTVTAASMIGTILQDSIKTETETFTYKALQGIRAIYYRLKVESLATSRDDVNFEIKFILPKRDF